MKCQKIICTDEAEKQYRPIMIWSLDLPVIALNIVSYIETRSGPLTDSIDKTVNCCLGIFIDLEAVVVCYVPWHLFGSLNHCGTLLIMNNKDISLSLLRRHFGLPYSFPPCWLFSLCFRKQGVELRFISDAAHLSRMGSGGLHLQGSLSLFHWPADWTCCWLFCVSRS